ncbi:hypothetical protein PDO_5225 [Rhizobium sp. PDO1-076]|nr:hypothetical protein PDO_5225 [Rhizobium sp. PDO1-076]
MHKYIVENLVPMNVFCNEFPIIVDMVYSNPSHPSNNFKGLYSSESLVLWADRELAAVILVAAILANRLYGWRIKLNDCLRTVEAQQQMAQYGYQPALVSTPGGGAHPRAMAVDVEALDSSGSTVDMGTAFDYFATDPAFDNPAARAYTRGWRGEEALDSEIWLNRQKLEYIMRRAAILCGHTIYPLAEEWWDFRMLPELWEGIAAICENDLHPYQRLRVIDADAKEVVKKIMDTGCRSLANSALPASVFEAIKYALNKFSSVNCFHRRSVCRE